MLPCSDFQNHIDNFAAVLWQHVLLRATGANLNVVGEHVHKVRYALTDIDPLTNQVAIGESICKQILDHAVQLSRSNFHPEKRAEQKAVLGTAVFLLDGAYGIDAGELLSVVARFLEGMENP